MKFAVAATTDGTRTAGVVAGEQFIDLSAAGYASTGPDPLLRLLQEGLDVDRVRDAISGDRVAGVPLGSVTLTAPIRRPPKIVAIGLNYVDHGREVAMDLPKTPLMFAKYPSSVIGPDEPLYVNRGLTDQADWEVELAVVLGRTTSPFDGAGLDAVFGYTVANDVTARNLQHSDSQWSRSKSLDGFCPLGPWLVSADEIPDPQQLNLSLTVNGETMQDSSTANMVFSVAEILAAVGGNFSFEPGDVVLTGTPPGVGMGRKPPRYLRDGETMTATIEGIGSLTTPVRDRTPANA